MIAILFLVFAGTAAHADVKATYRDTERNGDFVVEVADDGSMRFTGGEDEGYFLILDGKGYSVDPGPGGPTVTTADVVAHEARESVRRGTTIFSKMEDPQKRTVFEFVPEKAVRIFDFDGVRYAVPNSQWSVLTLTNEEKLLPLGKALAAYEQLTGEMSGDPYLPKSNRADLLRAHGVLSYSRGDLVAVSFEKIDKSRFAVPGEPLTLVEVIATEQQYPETDDEDEKWQPSIISAAYHDRALLTLRDDGKMQSWAEGASESKPYETPGFVGSFCQLGENTYLVTGDKKWKTATIWSGKPSAWVSLATIKASKNDYFVALDCSGTEPLLLTSSTIRFLQSGKSFAIKSAELLGGGFLKTLQHGGYLYVGSNRGEWGGGLRRVPLAGGAVESIDKTGPDDECEDLLSTSCSPVTGLAFDPARPECIIVSSGLVHFFPKGAIARVCDGKISLAYSKPYTAELGWKFDPAEKWKRNSSVPFYAATGNGSSAWVVSSDGLYEFATDPVPTFTAFPRNYRLPPPGIDWSNPKFVLILTDMNGRHSLSGSSLIMVPR